MYSQSNNNADRQQPAKADQLAMSALGSSIFWVHSKERSGLLEREKTEQQSATTENSIDDFQTLLPPDQYKNLVPDDILIDSLAKPSRTSRLPAALTPNLTNFNNALSNAG